MLHKLRLRLQFWYYTRLFSKLYWHFLNKGMLANEASYQATESFQWLTGRDYAEWYQRVQSALVPYSCNKKKRQQKDKPQE